MITTVMLTRLCIIRIIHTDRTRILTLDTDTATITIIVTVIIITIIIITITIIIIITDHITDIILIEEDIEKDTDRVIMTVAIDLTDITGITNTTDRIIKGTIMETVVLKLTDPLEIDVDVPLNQLNIILGQNGTGKTLIFKIAWFSAKMVGMYQLLLNSPMQNIDDKFKEYVDKIFAKTFDDPEEFNGEFGYTDKAFRFLVQVKEGEMVVI